MKKSKVLTGPRICWIVFLLCIITILNQTESCWFRIPMKCATVRQSVRLQIFYLCPAHSLKIYILPFVRFWGPGKEAGRKHGGYRNTIFEKQECVREGWKEFKSLLWLLHLLAGDLVLKESYKCNLSEVSHVMKSCRNWHGINLGTLPFKNSVCYCIKRKFIAPCMLYHPLPAQTVDNVDFKDGLLSNRVDTVKFPVVEDYFSFNKTQNELKCTVLSWSR